jgi:hypothetical protein
MPADRPVGSEPEAHPGFQRVAARGKLLAAGDDTSYVHVRGDYARHASAARAIAREYLASDHVLAGLLAEAGIATPSRRR